MVEHLADGVALQVPARLRANADAAEAIRADALCGLAQELDVGHHVRADSLQTFHPSERRDPPAVATEHVVGSARDVHQDGDLWLQLVEVLDDLVDVAPRQVEFLIAVHKVLAGVRHRHRLPQLGDGRAFLFFLFLLSFRRRFFFLFLFLRTLFLVLVGVLRGLFFFIFGMFSRFFFLVLFL